MNQKLTQIKSEVENGRYKKALTLIKKANPNSVKLKFEMLKLESICLFHEKKYQLAQLKLEAALSYSLDKNQKYECLKNLAVICQAQGKANLAIQYFKSAIAIDGSLHSADLRFSLVKVAFSVNDYNTVKEFAPLLKNIKQFSIDTVLILAQVAINEKAFDSALHYFDLVAADIRLENRTRVSQQGIVNVLNGYHTIGAYSHESKLLSLLSPKFFQEAWFKEIKSRVNCVEHNGNESKYLESKKMEFGSEPNLNLLDITGTNPKTVNALTKLKCELEIMGAKFNKQMQIIENSGNVSIKYMADLESVEVLMNVPLKCIPFVDDYKFSLGNGLLKVASKKNMLNPSAKKVMLLLVEFYNSCNKVSDWKFDFPLFAMAGFKDLFNKFIQARSNYQHYLGFYVNDLSELSDELLIKSFVGSRVLNFKSPELRKIGAKTKKSHEPGFIPIVDLINHKMGSTGYQRDIKNLSLKTYVTPGKADREVFVQYNLDDPLMTLLIYGFVDLNARWIYAVPVSFRTNSGLTVTVDNFIQQIKSKEIPNHLSGYIDYLPATINRNGLNVSVSKLIIPDKEHANSLKLIISHILKSIDFESAYENPRNLESEVLFFEKQIIEHNRKYWKDLKSLVNGYSNAKKRPPKLLSEQLVELSDYCIKHIDNYSAFSGMMLKQY